MPKAATKPYTNEMLEDAINAVKKGMAKKRAATVFGVPKSTLQFRLSSKFKSPAKGPAPILSEEEEKQLVAWIINSAKKGFPRRSEDIKLSVKEIMEKEKRPNPFTDNKPGRGWYHCFLRRNPELSLFTQDEAAKANASVSKETIKNWFQVVRKSLQDENNLDILDDPTRMFLCDETKFGINTKNGQVERQDGKSDTETEEDPPMSNITVLYCFSPSGLIVTPLIVYPFLKIPTETKKSEADDDWGIGYSENGLMTNDAFNEFVRNTFKNFLEKKCVKRPVVLFVNGQKTHLTYELTKLCHAVGIVLIVQYPNATRVLQPFDFGICRPLKAAWDHETQKWHKENPGKVITRSSFATVLKPAFERISPRVAANAFKACGLYPFDSDFIDKRKRVAVNRRAEKYLKKSDFLRILGPHLSILRKNPENEEQRILQELNAAFSGKMPMIHPQEDSVTVSVSEAEFMDFTYPLQECESNEQELSAHMPTVHFLAEM